MTVRALWETQNVLDCIPDALWDIRFGGAPVWQHIYHMLHELDQWFINPDDPDFVEPPVHHPHLQNLSIYPAAHLDRRQIDDYFYTIKAKLSLYLTSLHDEDLLQRPENCYLDPLHLDFGTVPALAPAFGDADGFCTGGHRFVPPHVTTEH